MQLPRICTFVEKGWLDSSSIKTGTVQRSHCYIISIAIRVSRQSEEFDLEPDEWELVVTLHKERFSVKTSWGEDGFSVNIDGMKDVTLSTDWLVGEPMMLAVMNGKDVTVQVRGKAKYMIF